MPLSRERRSRCSLYVDPFAARRLQRLVSRRITEAVASCNRLRKPVVAHPSEPGENQQANRALKQFGARLGARITANRHDLERDPTEPPYKIFNHALVGVSSSPANVIAH